MVAALALASGIGLLHPAPARAASPDKIEIVYIVAYAHNDDAEMDSRLEPMAKALDALGFTGFDYADSGRWTLGRGESRSVTLRGGYTLQLTVDEIAAESCTITAYLARPDRKDPAKVTVQIRRNAVMMLGGVDYKNGKLVVPIRVKDP